MRHVTFAVWFEKHWLREGEKPTPGMFRLSVDTGITPPTLRRAIVGKPLRADTAQRLSDFTGGMVARELLAFGTSAAA